MNAANYIKIELHDERTLQITSKTDCMPNERCKLFKIELHDECTLQIISKIKYELHDE